MKYKTRQCASDILEAIPSIVLFIRKEMRSQRAPGLSVPQFRLLAFLGRHDAATPSAAADHLGFALPSVSRMIHGLARKGLITRQTQSHDRRRAFLRLTASGRKCLAKAQHATRSRMAQQLEGFSSRQLSLLAESMQLIQAAFSLKD